MNTISASHAAVDRNFNLTTVPNAEWLGLKCCKQYISDDIEKFFSTDMVPLDKCVNYIQKVKSDVLQLWEDSRSKEQVM